MRANAKIHGIFILQNRNKNSVNRLYIVFCHKFQKGVKIVV